MRVFIVLKEVRGLGPMVVAVFQRLEDAQALVAQSGSYYLWSEQGELV